MSSPTAHAPDAAAAAGLAFSSDESFALIMDVSDPLRAFRDQFEWPASLAGPGGRPAVYLAGNSLGLMPKRAREYVERDLADWAALAVEGHFKAKRPWFSYHEQFKDLAARLVGARPGEAVIMNSLTVNLHLLMVSFFRPKGTRRRILIEENAFPSDWHAVASQLRVHNLSIEDNLVVLKARPGEATLREEDIESFFAREGDSVALLLLGGVNYLSGQLFDIERITRAAQNAGATVGVDLAHAAGNVPLALHDWNVDFAAWCSYKYLNSGPGALAGAFVHERHTRAGAHESLPRFEGWWGHDPSSRFQMEHSFLPARGADAWQLSNPPIFSMAPVLASLEIFDKATMPALRAKSIALTGYLEFLVNTLAGGKARIVTPREPHRRGAQLSIHVEDAAQVRDRLHAEGVIADLRRPSTIRFAPAPLYCSFHDCWLAARALARAVGE